MTVEQDHKIRDLGACTLGLRDDLHWTPRISGDDSYYLVEDPLNSKFYRVGISEYTFISLLDGNTSIAQALALSANSAPSESLSEREAAAVCRWLLDTGLAKTSRTDSGEPKSDSSGPRDEAKWARWNPILVRVPLVHPDRLFDKMMPWLGWLGSRWVLFLGTVLVLSALQGIFLESDRFFASFDSIFAPLNWFWLLLCWLGLKVVHECAHGLACKRNGGSVREAGVIFVLFVPLTYVDVTSSWQFPSKWQRIATAAAGMYAELLVASVAALLWGATGPGVLNSLCFDVVIMAGFTTLVFNANFLMKFDGYYILSDLVAIPNLQTSSWQLLSHYARKLCGRAGHLPPSFPRSRAKRAFIAGYGVAAFLWKVSVCACLMIAASTLFHGAGVVLALVAGVLWIGLPAVQSLKRLWGRAREGGHGRNSSQYAIGLAAILALLLLSTVPWPGTATAPAVVEYAPLSVVRAASSGFVDEVRVRDGQTVDKGETLVVLRNDALQAELASLALELRQTDIRSRVHEKNREMGQWQTEAKNREALTKKFDEKKEQVDELTVRSPAHGTILGRELDMLLGVYLKPGDEILAIGDESRKKLRVVVSQEDLRAFKATLGEPLDVRLPEGRPFESPLSRIDPRAIQECPHPALSATNGGPLPVKARGQEPDSAKDSAEDDELLTPRFTAEIELSEAKSRRLNAGRIATVALRSQRETVGEHLYRVASRWVRRKVRQSSSASFSD